MPPAATTPYQRALPYRSTLGKESRRSNARPRLAQDGELLGRLTQIFVDTVQGFYVRRAAHEGAMDAKTGAVTAMQRSGSHMRLNPHLHTIVLDGAWSEQGNEPVFSSLGHLKTSEVGELLEHAVRRIERHLDRRGLLGTRDDDLDPQRRRRSRVQPRHIRGLRPVPARRSAVVGWTSAPQAASSCLRQAALRITRWLHAARGHPRGWP